MKTIYKICALTILGLFLVSGVLPQDSIFAKRVKADSIVVSGLTYHSSVVDSRTQKIFQDSGLIWVVYGTGSAFACKTSSDGGATWSASSSISGGSDDAGNSEALATWVNTTSHTFWYAVTSFGSTPKFGWRYGTLSSGGCSSISWSISMTQVTTIHAYTADPFISCTSTSNCMLSIFSATSSNGSVTVKINSAGGAGTPSQPATGFQELWHWNGATWYGMVYANMGSLGGNTTFTGEAEFCRTNVLPSTTNSNHWASFCPWSNGHNAFFNYTTDDGSTWKSNGTTSNTGYSGTTERMIMIGDTAYIVTQNSGSLYFFNYTIAGSLSTETKLIGNTISQAVISNNGNNFYIFFGQQNSIVINYIFSTNKGTTWTRNDSSQVLMYVNAAQGQLNAQATYSNSIALVIENGTTSGSYSNIVSVFNLNTVKTKGYVPGTSTSNAAVSGDYQRKSFVSSGLKWLIYNNNSNIVCQTTPINNLRQWSVPITIKNTGLGGTAQDIWFNATTNTLWYVFASSTGTTFHYRYGVVNSSGCNAISWTIADTSQSTTSGSAQLITIAADSPSLFWVSVSTTDVHSFFHIEVWKNNGSWFSVKNINSSNSASERSIILPLSTDAKWGLLYSKNGGAINETTTSDGGNTWSTPHLSATTFTFQQGAYVSNGDVMFAVYPGASNTIKVVNFTLGGSAWGTAVTAMSGATNFKGASLSINGTKLAAIFGNTSSIFYSISSNGGTTWAPMVKASDTTDSVILASDVTSDYYLGYGNVLGILWENGTASLFNIRYAVINPSYTFSLTLTADSSSSALSSPNGIVIEYSHLGVLSSFVVSSTGSVLVDVGTNVNLSPLSNNSDSSTRYCMGILSATGFCEYANINGGANASTVSSTYYYYQLLARNENYSIIGGGTPTGPTYSLTTAPASTGSSDSPLATTYTITLSTVSVWVLKSSTPSLAPNPLTGSGTSERWITTQTQPTIVTLSGADGWIYYDQGNITLAYSSSNGGPIVTNAVSYLQNGTKLTTTPTTTGVTKYIDIGSNINYITPLNDIYGIPWYTGSPTNNASSAGIVINPIYLITSSQGGNNVGGIINSNSTTGFVQVNSTTTSGFSQQRDLGQFLSSLGNSIANTFSGFGPAYIETIIAIIVVIVFIPIVMILYKKARK